MHPTRSRGIKRSSDPCFKKTLPAVCCGLMPIPSSVMIAVVAGSTLNSSAANFTTAVNGMLPNTLKLVEDKKETTENNYFVVIFFSRLLVNLKPFYCQFSAIHIQTEIDYQPTDRRICLTKKTNTFTYTLNGSFGSDVNVTLNFTLASSSLIFTQKIPKQKRWNEFAEIDMENKCFISNCQRK